MTTFKALFHDREEMRTAGASVQEMRQRYSSMIKEEYLLVELAAILGDDIEAAWEKVRPSLYEKLDVSSFKKVIDCLQQMLPRGKKKNELVRDTPSCGPPPSRMSYPVMACTSS